MFSEDFVLPTISSLEYELQQFRASSYQGVPGVVIVDSKIPGPTLGITIHTHGNEPSGLAAAAFLTKTFGLEGKLLCGRVIFALNNLKATEQYFAALHAVDGPMAERARSSSEVNFNRLPSNVMEISDNGNYELARARELYSVWREFDVGFDIHSTTQQSEPMIILCDGSDHPELLKGFPIEIVLRNIQEIQVNKPAAFFYGKPGSTKIAIEAGSHEDEKSFECAIRCCVSLMQNLGMLSGKPQSLSREFREYYIAGSLIPGDDSFTLERIFPYFEEIKEGEVLATNSTGKILAPFDGHVVLCGKRIKPLRLEDEALFLSKPMRIRKEVK